MPRTIPWLQQSTSSPITTAHAPLKRRRIEVQTSKPSRDDGAVDTSPTIREQSLKRIDTFAPPTVEYMLPSDDIYIMVEDELCDIAHLFTRSLHRAEYQRLQALALASSKNVSTITEIQRPSNGPSLLSKETLVKHERIARAKEQEKLLKGVPRVKDEAGLSSDEDGRENSQWEGTNLGALMTSPGKRERDLSTKWEFKPATRAAAGFRRGRSELSSQGQSQSQSQSQWQSQVPFKREGSNITADNVSRTLFKKRVVENKRSISHSAVLDIKHQVLYNRYAKRSMQEESATENSEEEDDDLDAPIVKSATKSKLLNKSDSEIIGNRKTIATSSFIAKSKRQHTTQSSEISSDMPPPVKPASIKASSLASEAGSQAPKHPSSIALDMSVFDDFLPPTSIKSDALCGGYKGKAMAALARKRKMEGMP